MNPIDPKIFLYFVGFVLPGYFIDSIVYSGIPRRPISDNRFAFRCIALSICNYIPLCILYLICPQKALFLLSKDGLFFSLVWFVLIQSPLLGLWLTKKIMNNTGRSWLQKLGLAPLHHMPTSWEYVWGQHLRSIDLQKCQILVVTLKNGNRVAGKWGIASFASSDPSERDLYIEEAFKLIEHEDESGKTETLLPIQNSKGIFIAHGEIQKIEFIEQG